MKQKNIPQLRFPEFEGEWKKKKLGEIGSFIGGGTPSTQNREFWNGNIPWISSSDLIEDNINHINTTRFITNDAILNSATKLIPQNSILIVSRVGVGKVAVNNVELCTSQDFTSLILNSGNSIFFAYIIKLKTNSLLGFNQGTSIKGFVKSDLETLELNFPTLPEQTRIASFFTAIDQKLTQLKQKRALLEQYKKGVMQKIFSQELRFKDESGKEFPKWEKKRIDQFAPLQRGFDLPITQIKEGYYPVVFSNGILKTHSEYKAKAPGVVTGRSGTIGNVTYVKQDYWPHNTALWVTDFKGNLPLYVFYFYSFYNLERFGTGSGVPTLNRNDVHSQIEFFPCITEQTKIANFLSAIDEKINHCQKQIEQTEAWKKGLLQKMFC
jgi:type I restriction enzyme S subunit